MAVFYFLNSLRCSYVAEVKKKNYSLDEHLISFVYSVGRVAWAGCNGTFGVNAFS